MQKLYNDAATRLALLALALMMQWSSVSGQQYLGGSGGDSSGCSNTCYHCASMHSPFSDALPSAAASLYARAQCALLEGSAGGVDYLLRLCDNCVRRVVGDNDNCVRLALKASTTGGSSLAARVEQQ